MTFRFILSVFNHRTAFGVPRDIDWEEEVVVVTGGANGIGLCIAETYGLRGASVAVLDTAELEHADDRGISMYKCDVSNRADVKRVAKLIQQEVSVPKAHRYVAVILIPKLEPSFPVDHSPFRS